MTPALSARSHILSEPAAPYIYRTMQAGGQPLPEARQTEEPQAQNGIQPHSSGTLPRNIHRAVHFEWTRRSQESHRADPREGSAAHHERESCSCYQCPFALFVITQSRDARLQSWTTHQGTHLAHPESIPLAHIPRDM